MFEIFDSADIADLIDEFGVNCLYYKAKKCSCVIENNGRWDPKDDCYFGWRYAEPIKQVMIRSNFKLGVENINLGEIFHGGCNFTIFKYLEENSINPIYQSIAQADVIVNLDETIRKTDHLERGRREHLWAFNVKKILSVYYKSKEYQENKDYKVNYATNQSEKTSIEWITEGPEKNYSVEFEYNTNYWAFTEHAKNRGAGTDSLPKVISMLLRPYGEIETKNLLQKLDYNILPDENVNI